MNLFSLFIITFFTYFIYFITQRYLLNFDEKFYYLCGLTGTYILCGMGMSYNQYMGLYPIYYFIFIIFLSTGFLFSISIFKKLKIKINFLITNSLKYYFKKKLFVIMIILYFLFLLIQFIYPDLRLNTLFAPKRPDLTLFTGLQIERNFVDYIIQYVSILLFPFYLISLYYFRKNYIILLILLIIPLYFRLCLTGNVGRGDFIVYFLLYFSYIYLSNPNKKKINIILLLTSIPFLILLLYFWSYFRGGIIINSFNLYDMYQILFFQQTSFPGFSNYIINNNITANIYQYILWIITTPIPKLFTGNLSSIPLNYEISYIINQLVPGTKGFTVILTGVVTESVYIYGKYFFWIHPLSIGFIFGSLCSITENNKYLKIIYLYFLIYWSYILNRAGIASTWPVIINYFISFYVIIIYGLYKYRHLKI